MSHLRIVGKAYSLNQLKKRYEKEKLHSISIQHQEEPPSKGVCGDLCEKIRSSRVVSQKTSKTRRFLRYFFKTFFYFLLGLSLAYLFFMVLVYQLHVSIHVVTVLCFFLGAFLGLGLAFNTRIRCITCLCMPQLFSKRGRQALVAYAYILILTGPTRNTVINIGKLSESLLCNQEKMRSVFNKLKHAAEEPFIEFKKAIEDILEIIKDEVHSMVQNLRRITQLVGYIADGFEDGFIWLASVVRICNKRLGTPFARCVRMFHVVLEDCKAAMGPAFSFQCSASYLLEFFCYALKPLDYMCELIDMAEDKLATTIRKAAHSLMLQIKHVFYVNVKFSSRMHVTTNVSKTSSDIAKELAVDMHNKIDTFLSVMTWFNLISIIFLLLLVCKVLWYWNRFMTRDRFDNHYINSYFRDIDVQRAKMDKPTILPLRKKERTLYVSITSIKLLATEKFRILRTSIFLFLTTIKMAVHMGADYCLYWLMTRVYYYAASQSTIPLSTFGTGYMTLSGTGFMVPLFERLAKLLSSVHFLDDKTDQTACLIRPSHPNYDQYIHIAILLAFCWLSMLVEPYVLRGRNHVMSKHNPERARERALWLYRDITKHREYIYTTTRRQLRKMFVKDRRLYEHMTFVEYLGSLLPCAWARNLLSKKQKPGCLLCGDTEGEMIMCPTAKCKGFFCKDCWDDLGNVCSICKSPAEYGDSSDVSEEADSSDEEYIKRSAKKASPEEKDVVARDLESSPGTANTSSASVRPPIHHQPIANRE